MKKYIAFMLITALALTGCQYELSPWATDPDCSSSVSIAHNLERLSELERQTGTRTEYQVAILSDPQQYPGAFEKLVKHVNGLPDVDFILVNGDLADTGIKAEYEWVCKAMEKSEKPILAVFGNHDALAFGEKIWRKVFGPLDYSFTYQGSKFVVYNDNKYEYADAPNRTWLENEALDSTIWQHTFAVSHIAPWDKDLDLSSEFKNWGYDLGLHGHGHVFDYWQTADGIPHHSTINAKEDAFAILEVKSSTEPEPLTMYNCSRSECEPVMPRYR